MPITPKRVGPASPQKPAAVYLPIIPLYDEEGESEVTLFSKRGGVCSRKEAEAAIRQLPPEKQAIAEVVQHADPARLTSTLAAGDIREMMGGTLKLEHLQHKHPGRWRDIILNGHDQ